MTTATSNLLAVALVLAPASDPKATPATTNPRIDVTSVGCDVEDAELERLLELELRDLPSVTRDFVLHVDLRCDFSEIGILVQEPVRGTSLQRTIDAPEAAVGRERVLALAIRQLVDTSFLELVSRDDPPLDSFEPDLADPLDPNHGSEQASKGDPRAPDPAARPRDDAPAQPSAGGPAAEPPTAAADLVAGGGSPATQGARAAAADPPLAPLRLGLTLAGLGRGLDVRPIASLHASAFVEALVQPRWSLLGSLAADWTTVAELGGRVHALDLTAGFGARARLPIAHGPFAARIGADLALGWARVFARAEPGFRSAAIDGVTIEARAVAGIWATGRRGSLGVDAIVGGGPRLTQGTVAGSDPLSLAGVFAGLQVGASWAIGSRSN